MRPEAADSITPIDSATEFELPPLQGGKAKDGTSSLVAPDGLRSRQGSTAAGEGAAPPRSLLSTATQVVNSIRAAREEERARFWTEEAPKLVMEAKVGLERQRESRSAELASRPLRDDDDLRLPGTISGRVSRNAEGRLESPDRAVNAILRFVQHASPQLCKHLQISEHCVLSFPYGDDLLVHAKAFADGTAVKAADVANEPGKEGQIDVVAYAVREAVKKGEGAYQKRARLRLPERSERQEARRQNQGSRPEETPDTSETPYAFLRQVPFRAVSDTDPDLAAVIEITLNRDDEVTRDLRCRLGAQSIQAVFNAKGVTKEMGIGVVASLLTAGTVAAVCDLLVWKTAIDGISERMGEHHPATLAAQYLLPAVTNQAAEFIDSVIVDRLTDKLAGGSLMPESWQDLKETMIDSLNAGFIAAVGSIPGNMLTGNRSGWVLPARILFNQLAASTGGALVPGKVAQEHDKLAAAVTHQIKEGLFPTPEGLAAPTGQEAADRRAFASHILGATDSALQETRGTGTLTNSMGIGSALSLGAYVPMEVLVRNGVNETAQKIVQIIMNTPTEILSLVAGTVAANHARMKNGWMTTDDQKNALKMELVADRATERLANPGGFARPITEAELQAIEHPPGAVTYPLGRAIVATMNGAVDLVARCAAAVSGRQRAETLAERAATPELWPATGDAAV
jgi:hypothetical protein